jgi:transposase
VPRLKEYREAHADDQPALPVSERVRLRELERENRELKMQVAFLSKAATYVCPER